MDARWNAAGSYGRGPGIAWTLLLWVGRRPPDYHLPRNGTSPRLSWDGRLWDRSGALFEIENDELTRNEASDLIEAPDVQVAIPWCSTGLRWIEEGERTQVWRKEISPNFHDTPGWKPPPTAKGQLPFHAELWRSNGQRLLLITDRD